jgi:glycosyltransferase involved in cell wall biosynthesis
VTTPYDIVHIVYSPFPADPRVRREARLGVELGLRLAVICLADGATSARERWEEIEVYRIPGKKRRGTLSQYVSEYGGFIRRARSLMAHDPLLSGTAIAHVHSLPDFLVYAARPARDRGARVVLDLHEIFPEFTRSKIGGLPGRVAGNVAKFLEGWSRRQADATITVTRSIEALLRSRSATADERLIVLHNVPDPADFGPPRPVARSRRDGILRLAYHGTLTKLYGLDLAIRGVHEARRRGVSVTLDIIGSGPQLSELEALRLELGVEDAVTLRAPIEAKRLREILTTFDAALVPTRADEMTRFSLSTKLLEYVHLGLPVIAPRLAGYEEYFPDALFYFAPNDPASLGDAIEAFDSQPWSTHVTRAMKAQAQLTPLAWAGEKIRLANLYQGLLAGRKQLSIRAVRAQANSGSTT